jgi:hypothetical protein
MNRKITTDVSEFNHQASLFAWAKLNYKKYPELELMFAINNGLRLTIGQAMKAKRSGTRKGIPDLMLACSRKGFHGLFIEMKKKGGKLSPEQKDKLSRLTLEGYKCYACFSCDQAIDVIEDYLA